jgi:hypothetical protein
MKASRSRLLSLLTEACELEHGLACSYLFAGFSIKQDVSEGGLTWKQLQTARLWASEIYMVAAEEMLHLAQAWNMLSAVGGAPYYLRPNFPQRRSYYGFDLPLALERFGPAAVRRFVSYETPADQLPSADDQSDDDAPANYRSVGELYGLIREQIVALPEERLFFPGAQGEMGPDITHFPNIIPIKDRASALAAIDLITEQGEGTDYDRGDSHFAVFQRTLASLERERERDPSFEPARPVLDNPVPRIRGDWNGDGKVNLITDPLGSQVGDLFDDVYSLMLRLLQHAFASGPNDVASLFCDTAINAMTMVVKPLGESLARLPSGRGDGSHAGAAFGLTRHVTLPAVEKIALAVATERADELAATAAELAASHAAPSQLSIAAANLMQVADALSAAK